MPYGAIGAGSGKVISGLLADTTVITTLFSILAGVATAVLSAVLVFFVKRLLHKLWPEKTTTQGSE